VFLASLIPAACAALPRVVIADEPDLEEPFLEVTDWQPIDIEPPGMLERSPTLEPLMSSLRGFLLAGLLAPRADEPITIIVPNGTEQASEAHIFVVLHGGANAATVAHQLRVIARRDARGWFLEHQMEHRVFCDLPLSHGLDGGPGSVCADERQ
jgi:hypothetical protein